MTLREWAERLEEPIGLVGCGNPDALLLAALLRAAADAADALSALTTGPCDRAMHERVESSGARAALAALRAAEGQ